MDEQGGSAEYMDRIIYNLPCASTGTSRGTKDARHPVGQSRNEPCRLSGCPGNAIRESAGVDLTLPHIIDPDQ